jgi:hypothetical protein
VSPAHVAANAMWAWLSGAPVAVPVPVTPLVGRERGAAAVEDLVVRECVRLVTLTARRGG